MVQESLTELRCRQCQRLLGKARGAETTIQIQCKCKTLNVFTFKTMQSAPAARVAN